MPHTHDRLARWGLDITSVPAVKRLTNLPVIVDPSHSGGIRQFVPALALAATAAGADGVLIETHPDPERSVSDPDQALGLAEFKDLVQSIRKVHEAVRAQV